MSAVDTESIPAGAPRPAAAAVEPRRAVLDIVVQLVARVGNLVLGIVVTAVIARELGERGYGEWSTLFLITGLTGFVTSLGLQQVAVARASAGDEAAWVGALTTLQSWLSLLAAALTAVVVLVVAHSGPMLVAGLILSAVMALAGLNGVAAIFQLRIRNDLSMVVMTFNSVAWTVAAILLARGDAGLVPFAVAFAACTTATLALQTGMALRLGRPRLRGNGGRWRELVRVGVPVSIGSLLILAYARIDGLIVFEMAGVKSAGLYNSVYRIVEQCHFIPISIMTTLFPLLASGRLTDPPRMRRVLQTALDYLAMASLPGLAFAAAAAVPVIRLLYGEEFTPAAPALVVLMGSFVLICFGYALGAMTLVLGLQKRFVRFAAIALVFNVALNLLLVPRYGFIAAAWVTVGTEALVSGLSARAVFGRLEFRPSLGRFARAAIAAAAMGAAVAALRHAGVGLAGLLAAGSVVYVGALLALRALPRDELRMLVRSRREPS